MILFRPTGKRELQLVQQAQWRRWPPRLPEQPIFYPVTTFGYAEKIARDWNSTQPAPDNLGFATRFEISGDLASKYPVQTAGGIEHQELWVPAADLPAFNEGIVELISVIAVYNDGAQLEAMDEQGVAHLLLN